MQDTNITGSEGLLNEILLLLQGMLASVEDEIKPRLSNIENEVGALKSRINEIIHQGFEDGDLNKHRKWHEHGGWFSRLINKS